MFNTHYAQFLWGFIELSMIIMNSLLPNHINENQLNEITWWKMFTKLLGNTLSNVTWWFGNIQGVQTTLGSDTGGVTRLQIIRIYHVWINLSDNLEGLVKWSTFCGNGKQRITLQKSSLKPVWIYQLKKTPPSQISLVVENSPYFQHLFLCLENRFVPLSSPLRPIGMQFLKSLALTKVS